MTDLGLAISLAICACLSSTTQVEFRLNLGFPVGGYDLALLVLLLIGGWGLLSNRQATPPMPRPFAAQVVAFVVASLGSIFVAAQNNNATYEFLLTLRNFVAVPLSAIGAYWAIDPKWSPRTFLRALLLSGFVAGTLVMVFFLSKGGGRQTVTDVNLLRTVEYGSFVALLAAIVVAFAAVMKYTIVSPRSDLALGVGAAIGGIATLSRSDWVAFAAGLAALVAMFPPQERTRFLRLGATGVPILALALTAFGVIATALLNIDIIHLLTARVETLNPDYQGDMAHTQNRAYDSRLPGIENELRQWSEGNLLFGSGFGWERRDLAAEGAKHNVWSSTLAETGILGVVAYLVALYAMFSLGRRLALDDRYPLDRRVLGAFAGASGLFHFVHGSLTLSFNTLREAVVFGLTLGIAARLASQEPPATTKPETPPT